MSRRHLVVPRVGRHSLHCHWLDESNDRDWDLFLCPYEPVAVPPACGSSEVLPGPKWSGLRELLTRWDGWREYDHIWLPDDDLQAGQDTLNRLFAVASALGWDLCAPALHEESHYAHYGAMCNRRCVARQTGFVETRAPCFSRQALERLLPTLQLSPSGWGAGLEALWPKLLDYQRIGVIDDTPVLHTRPVGGLRDAALNRRLRAEADRLLQEHDCAPVHTVFGAIGLDMQPMALEPAALAALLAEGWRYLLPGNPAVLPWLVQAQSPATGWPAYPAGGTPMQAVAEPRA